MCKPGLKERGKENLKIYLLIRTTHIFYDDMFEVSGVGSVSRNCIFLTTNAQLLSFTTRSKLNKKKISNLSELVVFLTVLYTKAV